MTTNRYPTRWGITLLYRITTRPDRRPGLADLAKQPRKDPDDRHPDRRLAS